MTTRRHYPTPEEILSIEHAARRAQAAEIERLFFLAARKLGALATRGAAAVSAALGQDALRVTRATDIEAFAASLPEDLRARYASDLAAAARVEPWINFALGAWDVAVRLLAQGFRSTASSLHAAARSLDVVARRLRPAH